MMLGAFGLAAAPAAAQRGAVRRGMSAMMPMGAAEMRHVRETLQIGNVSRMQSELARQRGNERMLQEFAGFEVEETTSIATILTELSGMTPPPPPPADQRLMEQLQRARGAEFDRLYITGQLDGHERLLRVQEQYMQTGRNQHHRHITMLARGRIVEHIADLRRMRDMRS